MDYIKEEESSEEEGGVEECCCFFPRRRRPGDDESRALLETGRSWTETTVAKGGRTLRRLQKKLRCAGSHWRRTRRGKNKLMCRYDSGEYALNFENEEDALDERLFVKNMSRRS